MAEPDAKRARTEAPSIEGFSSTALKWHDRPTVFKLCEESGSLDITPDAGKDYWSKTFYEPLLVKHDAPALLAPVAADAEATLELDFTLHPVAQFDQAGAMILVDEGTWVKAGIEYCDGVPRLSCVVTNDGFSDWSTMKLSSTKLRLRLHKLLPGPNQGPALVYEVHDAEKDVWSFVRIASLRSGEKPWHMGPFAASPLEQKGGHATFHSLRIGPKLDQAHNQDPGHS